MNKLQVQIPQQEWIPKILFFFKYVEQKKQVTENYVILFVKKNRKNLRNL